MARPLRLVFDLDGTIVDSFYSKTLAFRAACEIVGVPDSESKGLHDRFLDGAGTPLEQLCLEFGLPVDFGNVYLSESRTFDENPSLFADMRELIVEISQNCTMAILIGKNKRGALTMLKRAALDSLFQLIVTPESGFPVKPTPIRWSSLCCKDGGHRCGRYGIY